MSTYYYCDCLTKSGENNKRKARNGCNPMQEVPVDNEGICTICGHYAMQFSERGKPLSLLTKYYGLDAQKDIAHKIRGGLYFTQGLPWKIEDFGEEKWKEFTMKEVE